MKHSSLSLNDVRPYDLNVASNCGALLIGPRSTPATRVSVVLLAKGVSE